MMAWLCSLSYVTIWDASRGVAERGPGALMAKVDIRRAYRNIPVHPDDWVLMGMKWEGDLFINTALTFGLRSASKKFNAVADAVEWIVKQQGVDYVLHYLDDFVVIGQPGSKECPRALATLLGVFDQLGLPVAPEKLEGPTPCITFLGFQLDSATMEVRLPPGKLSEVPAQVALAGPRGQPGGGRDSILAMELLPIVMACVIWGPRWRQSAVTAQCDNEGAVAVVNSGYSRVPRIMHCLFFLSGPTSRLRYGRYMSLGYKTPGRTPSPAIT